MILPIIVSEEGDALIAHPSGRRDPRERHDLEPLKELYHRGSNARHCGGKMASLNPEKRKRYNIPKGHRAMECTRGDLIISFPAEADSYGSLRKHAQKENLRRCV